MYPTFSLRRHAQVGVKPKYCPRSQSIVPGFPLQNQEKCIMM